MQRVTLYTAHRKVVTSHSGYIPVVSRTGAIHHSRNSPDMFIADEVKVDHLPIKRFCFRQEDDSIENRFVAFDRELEDVIQVMLDDYIESFKNNQEYLKPYTGDMK